MDQSNFFYQLGNNNQTLPLTVQQCSNVEPYSNQLMMPVNDALHGASQHCHNPAVHFQPIPYGYEQSLNSIDLAQNMRELHYMTQGFQENYPYSPESVLTTDGRRKRRRIITHDQRKAANVRERKRMHYLNEAFDDLRQRVPTFAYEKKLSRIETLKLAVSYIQFMNEMLGDMTSSPSSSRNQSPCTTSSDSTESRQLASDAMASADSNQNTVNTNCSKQSLVQSPVQVSSHMTSQLMIRTDDNSKTCDFIDIEKFLSTNNCVSKTESSCGILSCMSDEKI